MFDNKNFYPTPDSLIDRMLNKINGSPRKILEPSAGKGNIVDRIKERASIHSQLEISVIEIDPDLQATLRGKNLKILDSDFLSYSGPDKFDLIIANPPFDEGDKHLHKALDILYCGEIVFLLNAETLKNPCTNSRRLLVKRLEDAGASMEFIQSAFVDAERMTNVEVALVYVNIVRSIEDEMFAGADETRYQETITIETKHEVSTGKTVEDMVAEYNETVRIGTETILSFYRNHKKVGSFLTLNDSNGKDHLEHSKGNLTKAVQRHMNSLLLAVRTTFWRNTLNLKEVSSRMTRKKMSEFEHALADRSHMDFTENNIRQFVINLVGSYEQTLTEAVMDIFDLFTTRHCYHRAEWEENVLYFNGWRTNKAYQVNQRVVVPGERYNNSFFDATFNKWRLDWDTAKLLDDIDKVMNYFDGMNEYVSMSTALENAFHRNERASRQTGIESTYFRMTCHKKGTIHLSFKDKDILRRFNVVACRGKGWLPGDFGSKSYDAMTPEEQSVINAFEGEETYRKHVGSPLFAIKGGGIGIELKRAA